MSLQLRYLQNAVPTTTRLSLSRFRWSGHLLWRHFDREDEAEF